MLHYHQNILYYEQIDLQQIASQFGTPCYVYSQAVIEKNWQAFDEAFQNFPHLICYAVKANANLSILKLLAQKNLGLILYLAVNWRVYYKQRETLKELYFLV